MLFLQDYMQGGVFQRTGMRGFERKIKEAIVAVQLEKRYTKREIFTFYANHVTMGHGAYGVEAGAQMYFDKPARDLTVEEAATIAAIVQTPARLSPFVNPDQALARRNLRAAGQGSSPGRGKQAAAHHGGEGPTDAGPVGAPSFAEEFARTWAEVRADAARAGLVCRPLDAELQEVANRVLDGAAPSMTCRAVTGKPGATSSRRTRGRRFHGTWAVPLREGTVVPAVVSLLHLGRGTAGYRRDLARCAAFSWTRRGSAPISSAWAIDRWKSAACAARADDLLEQPPVESALVAIDNADKYAPAWAFASTTLSSTGPRRPAGSDRSSAYRLRRRSIATPAVSIFVERPCH
jgi:penicillin-binding protein 1A